MFCFVLGLRLYTIVATARKNTAAGLPKKINLPTNRGTSEGPETSVLELSTRRIHWCGDPSLFGHFSSIFQKYLAKK